MELKKHRHDDLVKLIGHIRNDKAGISENKKLNSYYELMYKYLPSKDIVDFIYKLRSVPVSEYIDNIEENNALLNSDGTLNSVWDNWYIRMTSEGRLDNVRFDKFRSKCFELSESNMKAAEELYRITRKFIIENPVIEDSEKLKYIFMNTNIKYSYKKEAIEYIRDCYYILKVQQSFNVCNKCGYVNHIDGKRIIHRLCNPKYIEKIIKQGTLILKPEIFSAITNPGRFELEVYRDLQKEGFNPTLFPEIEKKGDICIDVGDNNLYLDMKAYSYSEDLYNELVDESNNLKDKYRSRWIIVPDIYYKEQLEFLGPVLKTGGSKIYNINDLINKLKTLVKRAK
ncbi:restriction endonuclease-related protein [Clostridium felsineum]|uniref:REase associating with pPIWI RE domain-containing protein n=1 Tax=Clostridium felsineum TaxID=36839 RepID=A0A1S8LGL1_9CLOT|nr:hypothetical protein [Clostridium felsineum]URZ04701.1 hypothetical protein CLROS_000100 [Clostridium felsineum]URZ09674.1 hypothetical protein CROST_003670 [Clostridium felsineum]